MLGGANGKTGPVWFYFLYHMFRRFALLLFLCALALGGGVPKLSPSVQAHALVPEPRIGPPTACLRRPAFIARFKVQGDVFIDMDLNGPVLRWQGPTGPRAYQPPNWLIAGNTAGETLDREGNIYVFSAPYINLERNPPWKQNYLYRIGSRTGLMSLFMKLPTEHPPTTANPFGIMGLAYDCDTHSLYVSSVAGSSYDHERGRIFQIDLTRRVIRDVLPGKDAFGLMVYRGSKDKRLYFGSARESGIWSIPLDEEGGFRGEPRLAFRLTDAPGGQDERAMRILFPQPQMMEVVAIPFFYSLRVSYDAAGRNYRYRYDPRTDQWRFQQVQVRQP